MDTNRLVGNRISPHALGILLVLVLLAYTADTGNASPWRWRHTLKTTAEVGPMHNPSALFIDAQRQRYYIADSANRRLLSFDRQGTFIDAFDAGGELGLPRDLVRTPDGRWWVLDKQTNSLSAIDLKRRKVIPRMVEREGGPVLPGRFEYHDGQFYILDNRDGAIVVTDEDLAVRRTYTASDAPFGFIDFVIQGERLYALGRGQATITVFGLDGSRTRDIPLEHRFGLAVSLAVTPDENFLVLDRHRAEVAVFSPTGELRYTMFSRGQTQGKLYFPAEIRLDPWGNLAIVDEGNGRVEIYRH